ncbi:hypothetical protein [Micromonospora chersina]|uniref:hypothetical protein n=1 Tax=Micromonospora chersina TaxID=47854 RepID=UPI00371CC6B3
MGQQRGEFGCACRVLVTEPENLSDEVLGEVGVAGPVLRGEAGAGGVVQDGAEPARALVDPKVPADSVLPAWAARKQVLL